MIKRIKNKLLFNLKGRKNKPNPNDQRIIELEERCLSLEKHLGKIMDIQLDILNKNNINAGRFKEELEKNVNIRNEIIPLISKTLELLHSNFVAKARISKLEMNSELLANHKIELKNNLN